MEDVVEFLDTIRKPLEGAKRTPGPYPYYGASGIVDYVDGYLFDEELVLLSEDGANITDRNYPVCFLASGKYWVNNHAHVLRTKDGNENKFICNSLERKDYKQYNSGMAMPKLNQEVCRSIPINCPSFDEQKKIGAYLNNLDNLITLHQRKSFSKNRKKIVWEQRKLGTLCSLITKGTTPKDKSGNGEVNFVKVENIDTDNGEVTSMSKISVEEHEGYLKRSRLEENDILFSIAGTLGRVSVVKPSILPANTNQALAIIRTNEGYIPYLTTVLKGPAVEDFIRRNPTIGAQPNLSLEQVNNLDISYPEYDEQVKIGDYFALLDNLITLHQRKCDETKKLKKYMLQKMFPQKNEKKPEIRFAGFTDDWEQRKLEEIVERVTRKNQDLVSELPLTISAQYGLIDQNEFFDKRVASKDVSGYYLIYNGEFAYNKSTSTDAPWGAIKRLDKYENGVLSTLYIVFKIRNEEEVNSDFLVTYYDTSNWHKDIQAIAAEGARNHGLLNIAPADFFKTELMMPQDIDEQKKIGDYFKSLNDLITLHQRKCDEIKEVKKFMLQNMFPQKG